MSSVITLIGWLVDSHGSHQLTHVVANSSLAAHALLHVTSIILNSLFFIFIFLFLFCLDNNEVFVFIICAYFSHFIWGKPHMTLDSHRLAGWTAEMKGVTHGKMPPGLAGWRERRQVQREGMWVRKRISVGSTPHVFYRQMRRSDTCQ